MENLTELHNSNNANIVEVTLLSYAKEKLGITQKMMDEDNGLDSGHSQFLSGLYTAYDDIIFELERVWHDAINKLVEEKQSAMCIEETLLKYTHKFPILRKLMSPKEIKIANKLVKDGKLIKGRSDDKQSTMTFYVPY
jgi:hypothetical protein